MNAILLCLLSLDWVYCPDTTLPGVFSSRNDQTIHAIYWNVFSRDFSIVCFDNADGLETVPFAVNMGRSGWYVQQRKAKTWKYNALTEIRQ